MKKRSFLYRVYDLYVDGFRHMRLGKTLWAIILIKLFIIFVVLKLFFFPNFLKQNAKGDEAGYVATELTERAK
jgi:competence protein ComGC